MIDLGAYAFKYLNTGLPTLMESFMNPYVEGLF